ncbi:phosphatidylglycerol lysyltransferase domain-containing protein [Streptomyces europaeiscabiei]|uniref:Phosphatidylglycerol lysyltransferase domain-containing protein n=1 Tax=Streptomyces europaeiscabiei TaxID=146819 RepID=A0ABU4NW97_9ACTN|nr:phosphatidylglycerol lysyltransferase domain-containing protein [Streptomyces europaeiscabiei]MDX2758782.1 phosphatidylglycerol lysyltransferase domain-containing protein [Streptomyces europaeiscabiei]MDX2770784.1 phosphatidylglycerol lysyltransferase domain-containing protein [Streptomyces europaeiscabiei]MDX3548973.1 phosphatidylglycerol lysyltransferase domain-containing protein [Streptomyces europaeiscabiei]MDX3555422.1 phosphatidylglycerol lysyltransferase domain-containing protein [Str
MSGGVPVRSDRLPTSAVGRGYGAVRGALRGPRPEAVPALVARACMLVGLVDVAAGVFPRFRNSRMHTLAEVLPGALGPFAAALSLSAGVLLLLLAHGLRRRKRRAWRAAVILLPAGAIAQFTYRHSLVGVLVSLALLIPLLRHRDEFRALPDPTSRWRALANFVLMGAGSLLLGLLVVSAHPGRMVGDPSLADRLEHVIYGLFGFEGPVDYAGNTSWTVAFSLGALGLLTAITTIYLAFRPEHPAARLTDDDEARLRALLDRHGGRDSLGHFALRRDKAVVFSPSGKAAVTYRVVSGVMLASGDPIGDVEAWPGAIERFMDEAKAHSWTPAVMGCSETGAEVWTRETGLDALELGDEAVVDVADFSLAGRAMRNVRQMVKRIERLGYETRVRRVRDLGEAELDRIRRAAEDWRGTDTERGFSMALGRVGDPADGDCLIATAHKADEVPGAYGDLKAVLHFVPWGPDGASLDLMRRDRAADPGMNELLIVAALQAAPRLGVRQVSLNFAMFRAALARGEKIGAGPVLRAWRGLLVFLSRWFQIESLYKFNAKFRPRWEPRFVVYATSRDLPRIGFAAMQAEGFVNLALPRLLRRRAKAPAPCAHRAAERSMTEQDVRAA